MRLRDLQNTVRALAVVAESEAPFVSCYTSLEGDPRIARAELSDRLLTVRASLEPDQRVEFEHALSPIMAFLSSPLARESKGAAVFSRAGEKPYLRILPLQVPVTNLLSVDAIPNLFHLIALKDSYHRYVVLIAHGDRSRILEVDVGAITREIWTRRPDLRERVGRGWTRDHYQRHALDPGDRYLKEKVEILDRLMTKRGQTYLVLAGSPETTARIREMLPKRILDRVVDVVPAALRDKSADVVSATLARFIEHEQQESVTRVAQLMDELRRGGLAEADSAATLDALQRGQVDVLVIAERYEPPSGWACRSCRFVDQGDQPPAACPVCGDRAVREADLKAEMVRLAELHGVEVEVLRESDALIGIGGVGCLLKYRRPGQHDSS
jgi:hypothetical protein